MLTQARSYLTMIFSRFIVIRWIEQLSEQGVGEGRESAPLFGFGFSVAPLHWIVREKYLVDRFVKINGA